MRIRHQKIQMNSTNEITRVRLDKTTWDLVSVALLKSAFAFL